MLRTALVILAAGLALATGHAHATELPLSEQSAPTLALSQTDHVAPAHRDVAVQSAVWKAQMITFTYLSMNTIYSCGTLRDKVTRILQAVGAHRALQVAIEGCFDRFDAPGNYAVRVAIDLPVLATAEELERLESTRSYRELVARVRGDAGLASEAEEQFPAYWRSVALSRKDMKIEPSDCELVETVKKKVLPQLGVRVEPETMCRAREFSRTKPRLVAEVLSEIPH